MICGEFYSPWTGHRRFQGQVSDLGQFIKPFYAWLYIRGRLICILDFEPPIELDQVEAEFFAQENLDELQREIHRNTNDSTTSFYFCVNYITTILSRCRGKNDHCPSSRRRQAEEDYLARAAAAMRYNITFHKDSDSRYKPGSTKNTVFGC